MLFDWWMKHKDILKHILYTKHSFGIWSHLRLWTPASDYQHKFRPAKLIWNCVLFVLSQCSLTILNPEEKFYSSSHTERIYNAIQSILSP